MRVCLYLPALVMIISVPMSWNRFHRSAHCSSTWISSMDAASGEDEEEDEAASWGAAAAAATATPAAGSGPKEHAVRSARSEPSEPFGLASESARAAPSDELQVDNTSVWGVGGSSQHTKSST